MEERTPQPLDGDWTRSEFQSVRSPHEHERHIEIRWHDHKILQDCHTDVHRERVPATERGQDDLAAYAVEEGQVLRHVWLVRQARVASHQEHGWRWKPHPEVDPSEQGRLKMYIAVYVKWKAEILIDKCMFTDSGHHCWLPTARPRRAWHQFPAIALPSPPAHPLFRYEYGGTGFRIYELPGIFC